MTCNITATPLDLEPLPLYTRDPETVSILSAAPSYVSDTPTYTTRRPSHEVARRAAQAPPQRQGLPALRYAPGFQSRAQGSMADLETHNYNISNWSSITSSHASRQYQNVARRRASQASQTAALLQSLAAIPTGYSAGSSSSSFGNSSASASSSSHSPNTSSVALSSVPEAATGPVSPFEDPDLVGHEAAERAKRARLYREMCRRGEEAVRHESKTWDFMLGQMTDWEERDRSWGQFRTRVSKTRLLGKRLGLRR